MRDTISLMKIPNQDNSYWIKSSKDPGYQSLTSEIDVDVAVIGGGIAGLSTAYLLKQAGLTVAVLERNALSEGVTGNTTGKVTSQHSLCYDKLQKDHGTKVARAYGQGNQEAIVEIEKIIKKEKIDCDWQRSENYVFTEKSEEIEKLKVEAEVARKLGLPASFETKTPLPFAVIRRSQISNQS